MRLAYARNERAVWELGIGHAAAAGAAPNANGAAGQIFREREAKA